MTMADAPERYRDKLIDAARTIERLRAQLRAEQSRTSEPVAVIGLGLRMPGGADTPEKFWSLLQRGTDTTGEFPAGRGDARSLYHPDPGNPGTAYVIRGGFLDEVDGFDPGAFGISPREAVGMDPQQRLLLEVTWEALERAGYATAGLGGSATGVYVGMSTTDYVRMRQQLGDINDVDGYQLIGEPAFTAGRISYTLGLRGPSQVVDTTCSSSLVALHEACQALRRGDCDMALAGGVNLMLSPYGFVLMSKFRALSADGRCKTFDAAADGYARGEGAAILVLKRLSDAIAGHDTVHAVIRGSAVNHDGRSSGLTVPNPQAQQDVIRRALAEAGVDPQDVGYVEAHGTGTSLGDPIELGALDAVFGTGREPGRHLLVGSVKTNVGHLEPAAGVAGLLKVVLALRHREIPPHLNLVTPNPKIPWRRLRLEIPTAIRPWPESDGPPVAGVSSFGASGTNAHVVVAAPAEPATDHDPPAPPDRPEVLVLSAGSSRALRELAGRYVRHLGAGTQRLADTCFTSQVGRTRREFGLAVAGKTDREIAGQLTAYLNGADDARVSEVSFAPQQSKKTAWLFTGQGAQYPGMAAGLRHLPEFREAFGECARLMAPLPLADVIWAGSDGELDNTRYTQPALFAVEYALGQTLLAWGLRPAAMLGHSVGEITAACLAGAIDLPGAVRLVMHRARLMAELPAGGTMVAVGCDEATARDAIGNRREVTVAAVNGPDDVVLSGSAAEVDAVAQALSAAGCRTYPLNVSHAFHSPLIRPMLDEFAAAIEDIAFREPKIPLISNVTGQPWTTDELDPGYWLRHAAGTVRFHDGLRSVYEQGVRTFVELGPQPVLTGMGRRAVEDPACGWFGLIRKGRDDLTQLYRGLGALYLRGGAVDWPRVHDGTPRRRVPCPTYPWQHDRYWFRPGLAPGAGTEAAVTGLGHRIRGPHPGYEQPVPETEPVTTAGGALAWLTARAVRAAADGHGGGWRGLSGARVEAAVLHEARPPWLLHTTAVAEPDGAAVVVRTSGSSPRQSEAGMPWRPVGTVTARRAAPSRPRRRAESPAGPGEGLARPVSAPEAADPASAWQRIVQAAADLSGSLTEMAGWAVGFDTAGCADATAVRTVVATATATADDGSLTADIGLLDGQGDSLGEIGGLRYEPVPAPPACQWHPETEVLYEVAWVPAAGPPETPRADHRVLLIGSDDTTAPLAAAFRAHGHACQLVDPAAADLDEALLSDPTRIVVSALDLPQPSGLTADVLAGQLFAREQLVVRLVRMLAGRKWPDDPPTLTILTRGAVAAGGTPLRDVAGATLWGLGRTIALEHREHWGSAIDLSPETPETPDAPEMATVVRTVLNPAEDQVALRGTPLVPRLRRQPADALPARPAHLRHRPGTVLITGGWGGIGSALAEFLARHGTSRIVLAGRTGLPEESRWDSPDLTAAEAARVELCRRLRGYGAQVEAAELDVTDPDAVAALIGRLEEGPQGAALPLRGVIHAAGVSGPQDLLDCEAEAYRAVRAPKTVGAWLLHEHTADLDLDFFVCFSSIAATWGSQHLASYAAANNFLDALAQHRHDLGLPALAVDWGPWGVVSHLMDNDVMSFLESLGLRQLHQDQCLTLLARMVAGGRPHHVVCAADWSRYKTVIESHGDRPVFAEITTADPAEGGAEQEFLAELAMHQADTPEEQAARQDLLRGYLQSAVAAALRVDAATITAQTDLFTVGLDSLMVMEIVNRCQRGLGVRLRPNEFFTRSSLEGWAERLDRKLRGLAAPEPPGGGRPEERDASGPPEPDPYTEVSAIAARARLADDIQPPDNIESRAGGQRPDRPARVLLTGATGFVAGYLLDELLARTDAEVVCLVRCGDPAEGLGRIRANIEKYLPWRAGAQHRITVLPGDLARPGLGLAEADHAGLAEEIDAIYHAGAWVNFAHSFDQLHPANIAGTEHVLRLAASGHARVNHVSTYGIWGLPVPGRTRVLETDDIGTAGRLVTGYVQTKWGAEHLVRQAQDRGVDARTFRLGRVLGDSRSGSCLTTHFTCRVIKGCIQLGLAPDLGDLEVEMTPVDYVARALVHLSLLPDRGGVYHLVNSRRMRFRELMEFIRGRGWPVRTVSRQQWWEALEAAAGATPNELHPVMDTVREFVVGGEEAIDYDTGRAEKALAGSGIECPPLDERLLGIYLDYFIRSGYL
jgi:thioester reductase-like protein